MDPASSEATHAPTHETAGPTKNITTRSVDLDRWLSVGIWVAGIAIVALATFFGYSVYAQQRADRLSSPALIAVDAVRKQVAAKPGDAQLHARLAEALATAGQLDEAKAQLLAAIKIDAKYVGAYQDLATIELNQADYKSSAAHWQKVLDLTTDSQMQDVNERRDAAYFSLGEIALVQKDYVGAVGYFNAALRIRKDASDTYLLLAKAYVGLGQDDQALDKLNAALAFEPKYAEAHYVRGQLYQRRGDMVDAAWDFRAALDEAPDNAQAQAAVESLGSFESWFGKAQTAWGSKETSVALDAVRVARSIEPSNYDAAMLNGRILLASHDASGAVSAFNAALKTKPADPAATSALASAKSASKE